MKFDSENLNVTDKTGNESKYSQI